MEMSRFAEPVDTFALEDWKGAEIFENEEYLVMHNGDLVLDEYETIIEWVRAHSEKRKAVIE